MDSVRQSKVVANPTENTWAQVYSTLNLYVVLSVKTEVTEGEAEAAAETKDEKSIAATGKDLLERIQREYFSLDEKSLENIKKSIEAATVEAGDLKNISIVLANITGDILYLVVVSAARVILKRDGKIATIASGTPGEIEAYSGKIKANDIIILETEGFAEKITVDKLSSTLDHTDVNEIAESIAPLVHAEPAGNEAAIILQNGSDQNPELVATATETLNVEQTESIKIEQPEKNPQESTEDDLPEHVSPVRSASLNADDLAWEKNAEKHDGSEADDPISHLADQDTPKSSPRFALPAFFSKDKKTMIIAGIVLLVILLVGSIFFENNRKETAAQNQILQDILAPAEKKFEEANALISLNKGLALDEFNDIKTSLADAQGKLPEGSAARKKFDEFLAKVEAKISELSAGATLNNQKVISNSSSAVAFRDDQLVSIDSSGKISLLDADGKSEDDIESDNSSIKAIGANETTVFAYGSDGITASAKSGSSKVAVEDPGSIASLDTFGANLYALNTTSKTVDKYPTSTYAKAAYFTEDVTLNNPTSMSIDSSVWIIDGSEIRKFTKGKEEAFSVNNLTKGIGTGSLITTGIDYNNIYVLDPSNKRIVSISKSGEVDNQYVSKDLSNATSIAVDEANKKAYVVISGKLTSFDL